MPDAFDDWQPRRHGRLRWGAPEVAGGRIEAMCVGLDELLRWRACDRDRQAERRRDRKRVASRRGIRDLTVHERDRLDLDRLAVEDVVDRHAGQLAELGVDRERAIEAVLAEVARRGGRDWSDADIADVAWTAAIVVAGWSPADWKPGRLGLTEAGWRRLARTRWLALRMVLAIRAGYGRLPAGSIDAWWVVTQRPVLALHEIGWVLAAADRVDDDWRPPPDQAALGAALRAALDAVRPVDIEQTRDPAVPRAAIAAELGVSVSRARQIEQRALAKAAGRARGAGAAPTLDGYAEAAREYWKRLRKAGWGEVLRPR